MKPTSTPVAAAPDTRPNWIPVAIRPLLVLVAFMTGLLLGYRTWGMESTVSASTAAEPEPPEVALHALHAQVNPPDGYDFGVAYGDLGPQLVAAGVLDMAALSALYDQAGTPLSEAEMRVWNEGSTEDIVITAANSRFVLNFFWAVGLANRNDILTSGPMQEYSKGQVERFASTGGWTLSGRPVSEIYAALDLIPLTPEQQQILREVSSTVYRPCCDNPTHFPDCNHGMAMLGLLELLASQGATADRMYEAAKYANAYWFPGQTLEIALLLKSASNLNFADADGRLVSGNALASSSGFGAVHQRLQASGLLPQQSGDSSNCSA